MYLGGEIIMLKYFYYLYFQYEVEKDEEGKSVTSTFGLGYLSTKAKAKAKIDDYKHVIGFNDYPIDSFKIIKQGVIFETNIEDKSKVDLYELSHEYEKDGYDYFTIFSVFATEKEAIKEMEKQKTKKPYNEFPDNFVIGKWKVDREFAWEEGFTKWEI